jgi:hypothetical protein
MTKIIPATTKKEKQAPASRLFPKASSQLKRGTEKRVSTVKIRHMNQTIPVVLNLIAILPSEELTIACSPINIS